MRRTMRDGGAGKFNRRRFHLAPAAKADLPSRGALSEIDASRIAQAVRSKLKQGYRAKSCVFHGAPCKSLNEGFCDPGGSLHAVLRAEPKAPAR
jgi:hypothetical protein